MSKITNTFRTSITMSKREKHLFLLFFVVLLFWLSYQFIFIPQSIKLKALTAEKQNIENQIKILEELISKDYDLKLEEETLKSNLYEKYQKYYYTIDQPDIIHILNAIIEDSGLKISSMSFTQPSYVDYEGLDGVNKISISLPFRGEYSSVESFLYQLQNSSKKLLVDNLSISRDGHDNIINGHISLIAFSYGDEKKSETNYFYVNAYSKNSKSDPFEVIEGYQNKIETTDESEFNIIKEEKRNLIYDMESDDIYFMGSSPDVTGEVIRFSNGKYGKSSIRAEYFISTNNDVERAYIVLDDKNINIKYPPQNIGIWAFSYGYSPITIGMRFQDLNGKKINLKLCEGVNWTGWQYIFATPPQDIKLYPLKLGRIYFELEPNKYDYGVMLFDQIEADYPKNKEIKLLEEHNYIFYMVKPGDTLKSISKKFYDTESNYLKLAKDNGLDADVELEAGKVLVIAK